MGRRGGGQFLSINNQQNCSFTKYHFSFKRILHPKHDLGSFKMSEAVLIALARATAAVFLKPVKKDVINTYQVNNDFACVNMVSYAICLLRIPESRF